MMARRVRTALVVTLVALLLAPVTGLPAQATTRKPAPAYQPVSGSLLAGPCFEPSAQYYDPLTGRYDCDGLAQLDGTWQGLDHFHTRGTVDLISGDAHGSLDDLLDVKTQDQGSGRLHLVGQFAVNGATGEVVIYARIVSGDGDFRHAQGTVNTRGFTPVTGGPFTATYKGRWAHD